MCFAFSAKFLKGYRQSQESRILLTPEAVLYPLGFALCAFLAWICNCFIKLFFWDPDNCHPVPSFPAFSFHSLCACHCVSKDLTDSMLGISHGHCYHSILWASSSFSLETMRFQISVEKGNSITLCFFVSSLKILCVVCSLYSWNC